MILEFSIIRSFIWRVGRKLYRWARKETTNCFKSNGEMWLLNKALIFALRGKQSVFLDVGANKGVWSEHALSFFVNNNIVGHIHAFEPAPCSFSFLTEKFKGCEQISLHSKAISDNTGTAEFFIIGELFGTNSLVRVDNATKVELVRTQRLDDFLENKQIEDVLFLKSDTEGFDFNVLQGGAGSLRAGKIEIWQFEYNHRWISGRFFLKDVFDFIADKPYHLGRLYGDGLEIYEQWNPELEQFIETNYVLIRKNSQLLNFCSWAEFNYRNVLMPTPSKKNSSLN